MKVMATKGEEDLENQKKKEEKNGIFLNVFFLNVIHGIVID